MTMVNSRLRMLIPLLGLSLLSISSSPPAYHLELVDILYETSADSRPVTSFQADGEGGTIDFSIRHRTEGLQKKRAHWSFLKDISLIPIEGNRAESITALWFITAPTDETTWRYKTNQKAPHLTIATSGKAPKTLKSQEQYGQKLISLWKKSGTNTKVLKEAKTIKNWDYRNTLTGTPQNIQPGQYTIYTIHISTVDSPEITEGFSVDIRYVFSIKRGKVSLPKG